MTSPRSVIVVRAGDGSLHGEWIAGARRDFDIFISYYGTEPHRYEEDADFYEERKGPKWPGIADLLRDNPWLGTRYQIIWFPDDDLAVDTDTINRLFAFFFAHQLCLAQPALTHNSYYTWKTLLQDERCYLRFTGFVEVMAPMFSQAALGVCLPTFSQSESGWGLDWVWPGLCRQAGLRRIAIVDATPVRHTRPVGGELYRNHAQMNPRADADSVLLRYGLQEVRAVAKYSIERRVQDVRLALHERIWFWLKRLNGRRKHVFAR